MIKSIFLTLLAIFSFKATAASDEIVLKNKEDLKWETMLPDLGEGSPRFAILRVDPKTKATTLMIEFPKAIYIPKHTQKKSETHITYPKPYQPSRTSLNQESDMEPNDQNQKPVDLRLIGYIARLVFCFNRS